MSLDTEMKKVQVLNEKSFKAKAAKLGLPQKGQKQVCGLQHNALASLIHLVVHLHKVN